MKARKRSEARGMADRITHDDVVALFMAQRGLCALTGVRLDLTAKKKLMRNPDRPTLDRIDTSLGYVPGNCRLVTLIANVARCDFGDDEFYRMCEAALRLRPPKVRLRGRPPKETRGPFPRLAG
jgi:hypothetical protein